MLRNLLAYLGSSSSTRKKSDGTAPCGADQDEAAIDDARREMRAEHEFLESYRDVLHDEIMRHLDYWTMLYEKRKSYYPQNMTRMQVLGMTAFIQAGAGTLIEDMPDNWMRRSFGAFFPRGANLRGELEAFAEVQAHIYEAELREALGPLDRPPPDVAFPAPDDAATAMP